MTYPTSTGTARPFRLWDARHKRLVPSRAFKFKERAHMGALIECRWAAVGHTIEVFDISNGKLLGQYTRRVNRIDFSGE